MLPGTNIGALSARVVELYDCWRAMSTTLDRLGILGFDDLCIGERGINGYAGGSAQVLIIHLDVACWYASCQFQQGRQNM